MKTFHTVVELRQAISTHRNQGQSIAFVPTMGNLHEGHLNLVDEGKKHANIVVASIFVNPTQFGPNEDFDAYPRTLQQDQEKLQEHQCDYLFAPSNLEMYPEANLTWIDVDKLGDHHCGSSRPGHFRGVTTVVTKLFNIVQPDIALFGKKDFQQLSVIKRMVQDLFMPIEIIGVETSRAQNGLALSSRNSLLTDEEKELAPKLRFALTKLANALMQGHSIEIEQEKTLSYLNEQGFKLDYLNIVRQSDLLPAEENDQDLVILAAVYMGKTRLIDNFDFKIDDYSGILRRS